jgi:NAD(P)-dependent dehydrogenase (short-subunit alcohol dehydrogenase family)
MVGVDQRIYEGMTFNSPLSYAATKGAIISMSKWLASYWREKNIRVNILSPGGVKSSKTYNLSEKFIENYSYRTLLGRMADEYDYRGAILFLCSDASLYMTGSNLIVDGGWTAI